MNIQLGVNRLDPINISKSMEVKKAANIIKYHGSIINPEVTLDYDVTLLDCNYVYIEVFERYYYISNISIDNKCIILTLKCDVLNSFKQDIFNADAHVIRSNKGSKWLTDNLCMQSSKTNFEWRKLGCNVGTSSARYIISIGGK